IIHAGTAIKDGKLVTNGGRVLGVVAKAETIDAARKKAYAAVKNISWEGMSYRTDIGVKYREG
ncbi:MAG: phosphoribosylamine--glycine ligase, partial [Clostridia bacterium]|nr:phosphoribosylamine--glycine ligase [Clostridia bacterium]